MLDKILKLLMSPLRVSELEKKLEYEKAFTAFWKINTAVNLAVYFKNSIGRNATYCNLLAYDVLDNMCDVVWNVLVSVGKSEQIKYPMGQAIKAFDFDITPIMPDNDYNKILSAPIPIVYAAAIKQSENGTIRKITWKESQVLANRGIPSIIISKKINHVAITSPNFCYNDNTKVWELKDYDPETGPLTGNAGTVNGIMYMNSVLGFGMFNWREDASVFELRDRKTGQFLSQT